MSERSQAFGRLCDAALLRFAKDGYDVASLSVIAEALGIRKASLYSHVKSKDELFLLLFADALEAEARFAETVFATPSPRGLPGEAYLRALGGRFTSSLHLQLFLKSAYFPPEAHREAIMRDCIAFFERLRALFLTEFDALQGAGAASARRALYAESWLGIVDSICVELVYGGTERTSLRTEAMLMLLEQALSERG